MQVIGYSIGAQREHVFVSGQGQLRPAFWTLVLITISHPRRTAENEERDRSIDAIGRWRHWAVSVGLRWMSDTTSGLLIARCIADPPSKSRIPDYTCTDLRAAPEFAG